MKEETLSPDRLLPGNRRARIYIQDADGYLHRFTGKDIPGIAIVRGTTYQKNGKWSHATYNVMLADGAHAFELAPALHQSGVFGGCSTYIDAMERVPAPYPIKNFSDWLQSEYPKAFERLNDIAQKLSSLEESEQTDVNVLEIRYGGFTRRSRYLHEAPIILTAPDGRSARIEYINYERKLESDWASILHQERFPGHGGGYVTLHIGCPEGTKWDFEEREEES